MGNAMRGNPPLPLNVNTLNRSAATSSGFCKFSFAIVASICLSFLPFSMPPQIFAGFILEITLWQSVKTCGIRNPCLMRECHLKCRSLT